MLNLRVALLEVLARFSASHRFFHLNLSESNLMAPLRQSASLLEMTELCENQAL